MREETERDSLFEALGFFKGEGKGEKGIEVERRKKSPTLKKLLPETKTKNIKTRDKPVAWGCSGPQQMWKSGIAYGDQPEAPPLCGPPAAVAPPAEEFRDCPGCFRQNWAGRVVTLSVDSWKMGSGGERERERERERGRERERERERVFWWWMVVVGWRRRAKRRSRRRREEKMEYNAKRARALSNSLALRSVSKKSKKRPKIRQPWFPLYLHARGLLARLHRPHYERHHG